MSAATLSGDGSARRPTRVLLVEDQVLVAMLLEAMLAELDCIVGPFSRVAAAWNAARSEALDGARLDISLAGEHSFPIAYDLQARQVPFVFVTGLSQLELPPDLRQVPCLVKPVRQWEFVDQVGQFRERRT